MDAASTMMNLPLNIESILQRAEGASKSIEVVSRRSDKTIERTTWGEVAVRARKLARALIQLGVKPGDRVATLSWNHSSHLEAYLGVPLSGAVLHTLNLRLHPDDIAYIANDAGDSVIIVDEVLLPLFEKFRAKVPFQHIIVVPCGTAAHDPHLADKGFLVYDTFLNKAPASVPMPALPEESALGMCYSSGTTGRPKGVVYSHRSSLLHSLVIALPDSLSLSRRDTVLIVVPMFHVNAWGIPYACAMVGARTILPGPHLDAESLLNLMADEQATMAAGVPTLWMGIRDAMDANPGKWKLRAGLRMIVGGSSAPEKLIRDFDRQGMTILHAWGMTETSPVGLISRLPPEMDSFPEDEKYKYRAKQGVPPPLVELQIRNEQGDVPHDGKTPGEVLVRGPFIAGRYHNRNDPDRWTQDGYFRTGDIAHIDAHGFVQLTDRVSDMIKSGGEWISSVEIENALMAHPDIKEAAVAAAPHPKWGERPIAAVVMKPGKTATHEELREFISPKFAKYQLPDATVFIETIPKTSAGKFLKSALREQFKDWKWA